MNNFTIRAFIIFFLTQLLHSQEDNISLVNNYLDYTSHTKERLLLHTHKNIFLVNETIYFSGFVKNAQGIPHSSIVQVSLYDSQSKLIKSSLYPTENQSYDGTFLLEAPPGKYLFTASTINDAGKSISNVISQPIVINQLASEQLKTKNNIIPEVYVQPEGEELIIGFSNTIGFYISSIDQSDDSITKVLLKNNTGKIIQDSIPLVGQNFGSFKLSPKSNDSYELVIHLKSDRVLKKKLPTPIVKDIYFSTNTLLNDKLLISYEFSDTFLSINSIIDKDITIAIHNYDGVHITTANLNKKRGVIAIPKSNLHNQINIISVFDKKQHLLHERFVYNNVDNSDDVLSINLKNKNLDSISATLLPQKEIKHLSFSIAPLTNQQKLQLPAYSQLFGGYGKNIAIDDRFLFSKPSRKKEAQIDILCVSLGTSDLDWNEITKRTYKKIEKHSSKFSLQGQLKTKITNRELTITLYQKSLGDIYTATIKNDGTFYIEDIYLLKDEQIYYSMYPRSSENETIEFDIFPKIIPKKTLDTSIYNKYKRWFISKRNTKEVIPFNPFSDQEVLDEVTIISKKEEIIFTRNPSLSNGMFDAKKIDEQVFKKHPRLSQYLRTLGFKISTDARSGGFYVSGRYLFDQPTIVYVDGFRVRGSLQERLLSAVDEIYFEHLGFEGSDGGTLYIYTHPSGNYEFEKRLGKSIASEGFTKKEPFFVDLAKTPTVVYWTSLASTFLTTNTVTFPKYGNKRFLVTAHIFDKEGNFTIEKHIINAKSNE